MHNELILKIVENHLFKYENKIIKDRNNYEESGNNIELDEFFRNDLSIVIIGLCFSAIVFLVELLSIVTN